MHVHCGMIGRKIERCKVVPISLDFRAYGNSEPDAPKDLDDLVHYPGNRVLGSKPAAAGRHGEVETCGLKPAALVVQHLTACDECRLEAGLQAVHCRTVRLSLLQRERRNRLQRLGKRPVLSPEHRDELGGERVRIEGGYRLESRQQCVEFRVAGWVRHRARWNGLWKREW